MSTADVKKFEAKVKTDPKLREELARLQRDQGSAAKVASIAQKHGFSVSAKEVEDYVKKESGAGGALSDDALSSFAGAGWTYIS